MTPDGGDETLEIFLHRRSCSWAELDEVAKLKETVHQL